jgi:hypothetical protein
MNLDPGTQARMNDFFVHTLENGGTTPKGVEFNSAFSQEERFRQLLRIVQGDEARSLLDYGCAYGELLRYLRSTNASFSRYQGYDAVDSMIRAARALFRDDDPATFVSQRAEVNGADYVLGSGLFNIPFTETVEDWKAHIEATIDDMSDLSTLGFSFNMLTSYSDPERMRPDLFYGDPHYYFKYCRKFSRHIALLHDYELFDFTILVRKSLPR